MPTNAVLRLFASILAMGLSLRVQAADRWAQAEQLTIIMVDNRFQPDHVALRSGHAYELRLENRGKAMHEFTAPRFLKGATIRNKAALASGGTDIVVQPGMSARILLIAPGKGHYDLTCADHDWDGMLGSIEVN